jgi:hypothetical protein
MSKAQEYAKIDEENPTVATEWLTEFKRSYKI